MRTTCMDHAGAQVDLEYDYDVHIDAAGKPYPVINLRSVPPVGLDWHDAVVACYEDLMDWLCDLEPDPDAAYDAQFN